MFVGIHLEGALDVQVNAAEKSLCLLNSTPALRATISLLSSGMALEVLNDQGFPQSLRSRDSVS